MNAKRAIKTVLDFKISILLALAIIVLTVDFAVSFDQTLVNTTVNITNTPPRVQSVIVNDGNNIDLVDAGIAPIICNVSVLDYNGYNDVTNINVSFYHSTASLGDTEDNNTYYFNQTPSCTNVSTGNNTIDFTCTLNLLYYTNNGAWTCFADVEDTDSYRDNLSNTSTVNSLYGLNVTSGIDFGNMAVGDTSASSQLLNLSNTGNQDINFTMYAWGNRNLSAPNGSGYAFLCEVGNITVDNLRYNLTDTAWNVMWPMQNISESVNSTATGGRLTIPYQTNDSDVAPRNLTYWRLYVPPNPFGQCNGTVVVEAVAP